MSLQKYLSSKRDRYFVRISDFHTSILGYEIAILWNDLFTASIVF
jgi:hypothetical protein